MLLLFFNHPTPAAFYTLSLHDALPISRATIAWHAGLWLSKGDTHGDVNRGIPIPNAVIPVEVSNFTLGTRSEEHTSELQSRQYLVCRLLLEKKKNRVRPCVCLGPRSQI